MVEFIVPLLCFVIPLLAAFWGVRRRMRWVMPVLLVIFVAFLIWAVRMGQIHQGWDGIGYAILAFFLALPAILGTLAGGAIGWWRNRSS